MSYPGERVQIDVKFVPAGLARGGAAAGRKFHQYTAIDEFSRYCYLEAFEENSTYSSAQLLIHMLDHFKKARRFRQMRSGPTTGLVHETLRHFELFGVKPFLSLSARSKREKITHKPDPTVPLPGVTMAKLSAHTAR